MQENVIVNTFPSAKKEKFVCTDKNLNTFDIYVREPAQKNMANMRVRELVAKHFAVDVSAVQILTGHRSRKKRLCVNISK